MSNLLRMQILRFAAAELPGIIEELGPDADAKALEELAKRWPAHNEQAKAKAQETKAAREDITKRTRDAHRSRVEALEKQRAELAASTKKPDEKPERAEKPDDEQGGIGHAVADENKPA